MSVTPCPCGLNRLQIKRFKCVNKSGRCTAERMDELRNNEGEPILCGMLAVEHPPPPAPSTLGTFYY